MYAAVSVAVCCSVLQFVAVCCSGTCVGVWLRSVGAYCNTAMEERSHAGLLCVAVRCSVLQYMSQCVAVLGKCYHAWVLRVAVGDDCRVLQYVWVCCSVSECYNAIVVCCPFFDHDDVKIPWVVTVLCRKRDRVRESVPCVCVCMYIQYLTTFLYTYINILKPTYIPTYIYTYLHTYNFVYTYTQIHTHVCINIYVHTCICVYIHF